MAAYRQAAPAKPAAVVVLRGRRPVFIVVLFLLFGLIGPVVATELLTVTCTRTAPDEGTCRVTVIGALSGTGTTELPLRDLTAFRVDAYDGRDGDRMSSLVLVTTHGDRPLGSSDNVGLARRRALAADFAAFRAGEAPRFEQTTGLESLGFGGLWFALCALPAVVMAIGLRRAVVTIDPGAKTVHVRRGRQSDLLPLRPDVRIERSTDSDGGEETHLVTAGHRITLPAAIRAEDAAALDEALVAALDDRHDG